MKTLFLFLLMMLVYTAVLPACGEGGTETGNPTGENSDDGSDEAGDAGDDSDETEVEQACLDAGGEIVQFSNGCADSCESQREEVDCTQAFTEGCECGEDMCWTGSECEEI